jgi:serine/threonine protein kinase
LVPNDQSQRNAYLTWVEDHGVAIATNPEQPSLNDPATSHWPTEHFEDGEVLGVGGTAVVRAAQQTNLGREVAIKQLRMERNSPQWRGSLVREAVLTARLQHPGVIPVHSVSFDEHGQPRIVMQRVRGEKWSDVIRRPADYPEIVGDRDPLSFHLKVMQSVCDVVAYAHSHGVLHRDIKPDNVMIGAFGEVYLLDWGLAVALRDSTISDGLPKAADIEVVEGTPGYLAPEMARGEGLRLGERTDVYLLGATLHHVITGHQRHHAKDMLDQLAMAFAARPFDYPDELTELGRICNEACHRLPNSRHFDVEALRTNLADWTTHSASRDLAEPVLQAMHNQRLEIVGEADLASWQRILESALLLWSGNRPARHGLQWVFEIRVHQSLAAQEIESARHWISQIHRPSEDLRRAIAQAEEDLAREQPGRMAHARLATWWTVGFVGFLAAASAQVGVHMGWCSGYGGYLIAFVITIAAGAILRPDAFSQLDRDGFHAKVMRAGGVRVFFNLAGPLFGMATGTPFAHTLIVVMLGNAFLLINTQLVIGRDLGTTSASVGYVPWIVATAVLPQFSLLWFGFAHAWSAMSLGRYNARQTGSLR